MAGDRQRQLFFEVFAAKKARSSAIPFTPAHAQPAKPHPQTYTVRELIGSVRRHLELGFSGSVSVEGEVSNCRPADSGHIYFTLKDGEAQLPVVLFRQKAQLLRFRLRDGQAVKVRGRVSLYELRGQLQLVADSVEEQGTGALQRAFEELRARLLAEGLFNREKRPLPAFPHCIGIVTATSGAVIQDIVNVVRRRHARLNLLVYSATMQGAGCPASVAAGIRWFNRHPERVDLILLARGGGSLEDLAGFNDEALARVIAASALPVVSAIGHETDTSIADFVADLRAPTPSAAAELITAAQHRIEERVLLLSRRVERAAQFQLLLIQQRLGRLAADRVLARVHDQISRKAQRIDEFEMRLKPALEITLRRRAAHIPILETRLKRHDPAMRILTAKHTATRLHERLTTAGQAITAKRFAQVDAAEKQLRPVILERRASRAITTLEIMQERLQRATIASMAKRRTDLTRVGTRLTDLSPLAVLERGYALAYGPNGVLRSAQEAAPGDPVRIRLGKGSLQTTVISTEPE